ncbi:cytochrome c family protein [Bradyrhizobium sp. Ec3.3]|uniref:c-type cytochrome n=1 Tax=unclassified Bradyrhizobium TaxID=2631580 RepID=UPI0004246C5E
MKQPQFLARLALPKFGRLRDAHVQHIGWVSALVALGGVACMLYSPSHGQQPGQQSLDAASGQRAFNNACRTCHTIKDGDNRLGPHLYRIVGRKAGSLPDYNYSSAMKGADLVWDEDKLERFIANPDELIPGNSMKPYSGLASADDRARIVSFLRSDASSQ